MMNSLETFCRLEKLEAPRFWTVEMGGAEAVYAVSLHLAGEYVWGEYDAQTVYVVKDPQERGERKAEADALKRIFETYDLPIVLTMRMAESVEQQADNLRFLKSLGLTQMPVRWSDEKEREYEVFTKGRLEMGGFVDLMERVEQIGRDYIYGYDMER